MCYKVTFLSIQTKAKDETYFILFVKSRNRQSKVANCLIAFQHVPKKAEKGSYKHLRAATKVNYNDKHPQTRYEPNRHYYFTFPEQIQALC